MRLAHLVFLFACISFAMYMVGFTSPIVGLLFNQGNAPLDVTAVISLLAQNMTNLAFAAGVIGIGLALAALTGFSAVFLIPMLILAIIINLVLIPTTSIVALACSAGTPGAAAFCVPPEVNIVLTLFLNLIVFLAVAEYISGR